MAPPPRLPPTDLAPLRSSLSTPRGAHAAQESILPKATVWLGAGLLLAVGVASWWLSGRLRRLWRGRVVRRRLHRASQGELSAERLLVASGYRVIGAQVRQRWPVRVGERTLGITLIADFVVETPEARWVAEVKTGPLARDVRHGPTRRQILEYGLAFDVAGVLLVDVEAQLIESISFPMLGERGAPAATRHGAWGWRWVTVLLLAAALAVLLGSP